MKTLLFIGGGIETLPGVKRAKEMGLRVVVSDRNPKAPCIAQADAALIADTYDPVATLAAVGGYTRDHGDIDGVLCLATDVPQTVAAVAHALNLPGISEASAALAADKLAMKDRFAERGVAIPWYRSVTSAAMLEAVIEERGYDLVVKPVDSRGARGVIRMSPQISPRWAYEYARRISPTNRVMLEAYLNGPQISTESLVIDGHVYTPGFSDRNYEYLERYQPFFIENGGDLPSCLPDEQQVAVKKVIAQAAAALDIHDGVVKGDVVVHQGKAHVIEIAARLSGGYFCTHSIPLNVGVDFVGAAIRQCLGLPVSPESLQPQHRHFVCQRYLFPEPGRVIQIQGVEEVSTRPEIVYCELRRQVGDLIESVENHPGRAGVLTAIGPNRATAAAAAIKAVSDIHIVTEPVPAKPASV